jgi:hypothetical protein
LPKRTINVKEMKEVKEVAETDEESMSGNEDV